MCPLVSQLALLGASRVQSNVFTVRAKQEPSCGTRAGDLPLTERVPCQLSEKGLTAISECLGGNLCIGAHRHACFRILSRRMTRDTMDGAKNPVTSDARSHERAWHA